jgi:hypothetical protein
VLTAGVQGRHWRAFSLCTNLRQRSDWWLKPRASNANVVNTKISHGVLLKGRAAINMSSLYQLLQNLLSSRQDPEVGAMPENGQELFGS